MNEIAYFNPAKTAQAIEETLKQGFPVLKWRVEYDDGDVTGFCTGFKVRGTLSIDGTQYNSVRILSIEEYNRQEQWAECVVYGIFHGIADLILRESPLLSKGLSKQK